MVGSHWQWDSVYRKQLIDCGYPLTHLKATKLRIVANRNEDSFEVCDNNSRVHGAAEHHMVIL